MDEKISVYYNDGNWVVEAGMPGYLPNTYEEFADANSAIEYAIDIADNGDGTTIPVVIYVGKGEVTIE